MKNRLLTLLLIITCLAPLANAKTVSKKARKTQKIKKQVKKSKKKKRKSKATIDPITGQVIDENAVKKNYTINLSSFLTTNLFEFQNRDDKAFANISSLSTIYNLQNGYRISSSISFIKDFTSERKTLLRDSSIRVIHSFGEIFERVTLAGTGSIRLPLSKASHTTAGLITGFTATPTFIIKVSDLVPGLGLFYTPSLTYNVHEYKVASTGASNSQYVANNNLTLGYSFLEKFYLQISNSYGRSWSYAGNTNDSFGFDQSVLWSAGSGFTLLAGHNIGGSALAVNGQDSNLQLFGSRESTFYGGVVYTY
jgi:hypothetical protein